MTWKGFPHYWPVVRGIHPHVTCVSPHKESVTRAWCFLLCWPTQIIKQSSYRWFEMPWCSYDVTIMVLQACCLHIPVYIARVIKANTSGGITVTWQGHPGVSNHTQQIFLWHDDVIKWKHFPRCWPFVRGIHRSQVNSPHKGQWRGALMFSLIWAWIKGFLTMTMTMTMKYSLLPSDIQFIINTLTKEIIHITCVKSINLAKGAWSHGLCAPISSKQVTVF